MTRISGPIAILWDPCAMQMRRSYFDGAKKIVPLERFFYVTFFRPLRFHDSESTISDSILKSINQELQQDCKKRDTIRGNSQEIHTGTPLIYLKKI